MYSDLQKRRRRSVKSAAFYRDVLDTMLASVAVLDADGTIIAVNASWTTFAQEDVLSGHGVASLVGASYLSLCTSGCQMPVGEYAAEALAGVRSVLEGKTPVFMIEYPVVQSRSSRWFVLRISRFQQDRPGAVVSHLEITERKKAEEATKASEERLETVIENLSKGIVLARMDGRLLHWNPAALRLHGFPPSAEWCRDLSEFTSLFELRNLEGRLLSPEEWPLARLFRRDKFAALELRVSRLDISWERIFRYHGGTVRQSSGEEVAFLSIDDLTERKQTEEALENNQRFLSGLIEHSGSLIFAKDGAGRYEMVNRQWEEIMGLPRSEAIGKTDAELFLGADAERLRAVDLEIMSSGTNRTVEEKLHTIRGLRCFLSVKFPLYDSHGQVRGVCGMAAEITERQRAEEKVREQAALLDKAQDAILVRDLDHRITYWNKSAERLYGWKASEVLGQCMEKPMYEDEGAFRRATEATLTAGEWVGEIEQQTREGRKLVVEGRWTLVRDDEGKPKGVLAINTDLTERKKLEQQFLRAQRLESIGTLAGGIAHDLNNVLGPIMMSLELLQMRCVDESCHDLISIIGTSAQRGADMVRQVLSFARGVEGQRLEVQVRHLVHDMEKIINETFLKHVQVRSMVPVDLWTVLGDATQLHQVLLNLCVNARDAMPEGGQLTIVAENLLLDENYAGMEREAVPGPYVVLQVEDTGVGMPPKIIEKIFDPFFTTKDVGRGTGLGLSTTIAIVKSHGGFIRVYSEVNQGTQFKIYLPAICGSTSAPSREASPSLPRGHGECILVVDDESSVRQITQQTLEAFGYRVLVAMDGADALAIFAPRQAEIAGVLTDMMMPVMDGFALVQVLRKLNPKLPVLAASGLSANGHAARASSLGIQHFLPKPYTAATLLRTLRVALDERAEQR